MNDIVQMAILEGTANLTRKLACHPFSQTAVADDVVEHLAAVDILSNHVVVVLVHDHLAHAADVWVIQQHRQRCLAQCAYLLGGVFRGLARLLVGCVARGACWRWMGVYSRQNLDSQLVKRMRNQ